MTDGGFEPDDDVVLIDLEPTLQNISAAKNLAGVGGRYWI
jgi:hypothetical protein